MQEILLGSTPTIKTTVPSGITGQTITITDEWGGTMLSATTFTVVGTVATFVLPSTVTASNGVMRAVWAWTGPTAGQVATTFDVITQYIDSNSFFTDFPETDNSTNNDAFTVVERRVRNVIDTYCGQSFRYYPGKTFVHDGSNRDRLRMYFPVLRLTKVLENNDPNNDKTTDIEICPETSYYIRKKFINPAASIIKEVPNDPDLYFIGHYFKPRNYYYVTGDFGFEYVPNNVSEAAKLLIADTFNMDSTDRRHRVAWTSMPGAQVKYEGDLLGSTGNIDADVLLMDYQKFIMDYIV